ncbi:hypothetical protein POVCU2_0046190 [Plasmodium ovale curtisi]|uniref:Uncharacterized protein n=1 Tax=Plasmodium ovale curtisi TaxID=864141 RepID=A0A1A8W7X0_PLAOA|nr:hypothetical protein POVCU2_0046190 [Plasmodium ovale curtisi]
MGDEERGDLVIPVNLCKVTLFFHIKRIETAIRIVGTSYVGIFLQLFYAGVRYNTTYMCVLMLAHKTKARFSPALLHKWNLWPAILH